MSTIAATRLEGRDGGVLVHLFGTDYRGRDISVAIDPLTLYDALPAIRAAVILAMTAHPIRDTRPPADWDV